MQNRGLLRKYGLAAACSIAALALSIGAVVSYKSYTHRLEMAQLTAQRIATAQQDAERQRIAHAAAAAEQAAAALRKAPVACAQTPGAGSPSATDSAPSDVLAGALFCGSAPALQEAQDMTGRMITITDLNAFAREFSLQQFFASKVGDGEKAVEELMRACLLAESMRLQSREFYQATSLDRIERTLNDGHDAGRGEWQSILSLPRRASLLAVAPRFSDPPDFNLGRPRLKFIYEIGLETSDETEYDNGFAVMVNPALYVEERDREEFLADVLQLRDPKYSARDFIAKWLVRAPLGSVKVSCAARRNEASDWIWFEAMIAKGDTGVEAELLPLHVALGPEAGQIVNVGILSSPARDDAVIPYTCKQGIFMCGSRYYWLSDDRVIGLQRSMAGVGTCSQCHRSSLAFHSRRQETTREGNLESLGIPTFFAHLSANFRHPELGPAKSRFQTSWEKYHSEVLLERSKPH